MRKLTLACALALIGSGPLSSALSAPPSFFPLGKDVYHAKDRLEAEKKLLRFIDEPRWFNGFPKEVTREAYDAWIQKQGKFSLQELQSVEQPKEIPSKPQIPTKPAYPRAFDELPLRDQGATLRLSAESEVKAADGEIVMTLTLAAGERAVQREIEHRRTNALPFLFAFIADGAPVSHDSQGGISNGGTRQFIELVSAKSQKAWNVRMAIESLEEILPDATSEAAIIAVFSERQHEFYGEGQPIAQEEVWNSDALKERPPQIVLRSNVLRLRKDGAKWIVRMAEN